jgi:hypothetical protein
MSENYYQMAELANKITAFDCAFSDGGNYGSRLRTLILGAASNNTQARFVSSILTSTNKEAMELINTGIGLITGIGRILHTLLDDSVTIPHRLIGNWQKLDRTNNIVERITASCARINNFIRLMQFLTEDESSDIQSVAA